MRRLRALGVVGVLAVLGLGACGGSEERSGAAAEPPPPREAAPASAEQDPVPPGAERPSSPVPPGAAAVGLVVASGVLELPGASGIGDTPGFHEAVLAEGVLPAELPATEGGRLVLSLRDASRPGISCEVEHPLSGCATVDWSDFEERPRVPAGGVFEQRLRLTLASGEHAFFLSESGVLNAEPDSYAPG